MTPMIPVADRMTRIQPFYVMAILARAREMEAKGRSVVHMEIGEPDFVTPDPIIQAGHAALAAGETHYTPALGLPALRQAIADHYHRAYGLNIDPVRVCVTPGASGALMLILGALINPGERVLLADPGYPCNRHFVELVNGVPVGVPVDGTTGYQLTAEVAAAAWQEGVRAVLVASPANPTGTLLTGDQIKALYRLTQSRGAVLIVDEIYQGLVYDLAGETALSQGQGLFVVNSFSKYFGMTGWRLGWTVAPEEYIDPLDRLAQNIFLSAPTLSQHAALKAFTEETERILQQRRQTFRQRRDYLLPALKQLGFQFAVEPKGAFYLYADCSNLADDSEQFARRLLEEKAVAVTPGRDFGSHLPERYLRFSYTTDTLRLEQGVERIRQFLDGQ